MNWVLEKREEKLSNTRKKKNVFEILRKRERERIEKYSLSYLTIVEALSMQEKGKKKETKGFGRNFGGGVVSLVTKRISKNFVRIGKIYLVLK